MPPDRKRDLRLKVDVPTQAVVEADVTYLATEGPVGHFTLLPRHIDYVSLIVPGIFIYRESGSERERYLGVDEGVLVKCGRNIRVALRDAVAGEDLSHLRQEVERRFVAIDEEVRQARSALARLEAGAVRRLVELEKS